MFLICVFLSPRPVVSSCLVVSSRLVPDPHCNLQFRSAPLGGISRQGKGWRQTFGRKEEKKKGKSKNRKKEQLEKGEGSTRPDPKGRRTFAFVGCKFCERLFIYEVSIYLSIYLYVYHGSRVLVRQLDSRERSEKRRVREEWEPGVGGRVFFFHLGLTFETF